MKKMHKGGCIILGLGMMGVLLNNQGKVCIQTQGETQNVTVRMTLTQPSGKMEDFDKVMEKINERMGEELNLQLKIDFISMDDDSLLEYLSEHTDADLIMVSGIKDKVSKNMLVPLDQLLLEEGEAIRTVIPKEYLDLGKVDGVQYGVTLNRDMAEAYGVMMRKDLIEKYQIDLSKIQTWDDFEEVLKIITEKEEIYGIAADTLRAFDGLGDSFGVLMSDDEQMQVVDYYETQEFYDWISRIEGWKEKGYLYDKEELRYKKMSDRPFLYELLREGKLFSYVVKYKPGIDAQESKSVGTELVSVMLTEPVMTTKSSASQQYGIYAESQHPREAMQVLNFLYKDQEVVNLLCWGIEGEHYEKNEDGSISYPKGKEESEIGYNFNVNWTLPNPYLAYVWEGDSLNLEEELHNFNQSAKKSPALGFVFDDSAVSVECEMVSSVVNMYVSGFLSGSFDVDKMFPRMIQELKENGMDLIIEEKQRQLDQWRESQSDF